MNENAVKVKKKEENFREKVRFGCFFLILLTVLSLWLLHHQCAVYGLPQWMKKSITNFLDQRGYQFSSELIKFSFTDGLTMVKPALSEKKSGIEAKADLMQINVFPMDFFKGIFCPLQIHIVRGRAEIPLLPETGNEGKMDRLIIRDLNSEIRGKPGLLFVRSTSAMIGNIHVRMEGTIDNLLHKTAENLFLSYWDHGKHSSRETKKSIPEKNIQKESYGIIELFPFEIRKKFMNLYLNFEQSEGKRPPQCELKFHLDLNDFQRCTLVSEIQIPAFRYGGMNIREMREKFSLQNGVLKLEQISADLGNGSNITAEGVYNDSGKEVSGKISGNCHVQDLMGFLNPELRTKIEEHIQFGKEKISFNGILNNFSVANRRYQSTLVLVLPEIIVDGIVLNNAVLNVSAETGKLTGSVKQASVKDGGSVSGNFVIDNSGIHCNLQGETKLQIFQQVFPEKIRDFIQNHISYNGDEEPISFSGNINSDNMKERFFSGNIKLKYPHIRINGVEIQNIDTDVEFTPELFRFKKISAETKDGSSFSGTITCDLKKEQITARVVCSGIPGKIAAVMDTLWQTESLQYLAKDVSCPDPKGVVEGNLDLIASYGNTPFYYISGEVVMKDPIYCGVPFRYGAARFITDSDYNLIMPDIILESETGALKVEAIYRGDPKNAAGGRLHFNVKSSIKGNDLLKIFYPYWSLSVFDFPDPIDLTSSGVIDYSDQKKSEFKINLQNCSCRFAGAKLTDINAVIDYQNWIFLCKNARGTLSKGSFNADFSCNFFKGTGSFSQTLENADLTDFLREFNISDYAPAGTGNGKLSFVSSADFSVQDNGNLSMNGTGNLDLKGDDLWNIPILSSFLKYIGDAWPMLKSGAGISRVSCNMEFKNDRAVIREVNTNGNLISMDADGYFCWNTGDYNMTFRSELLKNTLPFEAMSKILSPVSWIMSKTFKGVHSFTKKDQSDKK